MPCQRTCGGSSRTKCSISVTEKKLRNRKIKNTNSQQSTALLKKKITKFFIFFVLTVDCSRPFLCHRSDIYPLPPLSNDRGAVLWLLRDFDASYLTTSRLWSKKKKMYTSNPHVDPLFTEIRFRRGHIKTQHGLAGDISMLVARQEASLGSVTTIPRSCLVRQV